MRIRNTIAGGCKTASKLFFFMFALLGAMTFVSCSETEEEQENEFENWESRNETYFSNIYSQAESAINSGSKEWKIIRVYSKDEDAAKDKKDYIVVHVENEGVGTECPNLSDTVRLHYRGNLMPSTSYVNGYQFVSSWQGEYNIKSMIPVGGYAYNCISIGRTYVSIPGVTTALLNMHKGDHWKVYVPYDLGNSALSSIIPSNSTLKFDLTLVDFLRKGQKFPSYI